MFITMFVLFQRADIACAGLTINSARETVSSTKLVRVPSVHSFSVLKLKIQKTENELNFRFPF